MSRPQTPWIRGAFAAALVGLPIAARAQTPATIAPVPAPRASAAAMAPTSSATSPSAPPPAPPGVGDKGHLSGDDLARKKEGGYFTGVPLANYDPTLKFGFGARLYYYFNGDRSNPLFPYTPYFERIIAQTYFSTGGAQDHLLDFDAPNFLGSLYRVRATLEYEADTAWPYYGIGSRSLAPLSFPGAPGKTFATQSAFTSAKGTIQPNGTTYGLYNLFGFRHPTLQLGAERLLLGGVLRPFIGLGFNYTSLTDFTGRFTDATDSGGNGAQAGEATTLLARDCATRSIVGCNGGFDNVLRLAVSIDTRDFEPDPNSGIYSEISTEIATKALASRYDYVRTMFSLRAFYSPIPKKADLVLAWRGVYEIQSSGTPFYALENMPFIDDNHAGLGGFRTLRGFDQNRFVGPIIALTNYEVRWTFTHVRALHQDFGLIAVPFLDIGRVFDSVGQTSLAGWKRTQGAGFRVAWNEATIIMVDYGFSSEGSGLYVNFNHIF